MKKKTCPRKKLGQLHTDTFLLILSPSVPKTVKNEATKKQKWGKKRQISLIQSNPNSSPQPETWELFMEQETRVSVYWWSAKKKRPMWPESEGTGITPRWGARLGSHSTLPAPFLALCAVSSLPTFTMGIQQAVADINSSVWSLSNCLLLLSTQIFIFYEAEQGCHYNSGFSWLPPSYGWNVHNVWKMSSCNNRDGKATYHRGTWLDWCALQTQGYFMNQSLQSWGPLSPLCFLSFGFFWRINYLIIFRH